MSDLLKLLDYWFPSESYQEFWFDGSQDIEIIEKFNDLLKSSELLTLDEILDNIHSSNDLLAYIILFDQITRNISRIENTDFRRNDKIGLTLAKIAISRDLAITFPFNQRMFVFLPFRHSRTTPNLNFVINNLTEYFHSKSDQNHKKLLDRFWLATIKDYSKVSDTIIVHENTENSIVCHPEYDTTIHDDISTTYSTNLSLSPTIQFTELYKSVKNFVTTNSITRIGISLSGGVDSNVLMYILYALRCNNIIDTLVAIHVDYGNRDISSIEAQYLFNVCAYFKIPMVTRQITHITRSEKKIDRAIYEEETKKIRFGLYKHAIKLYGIQGVCLGHHRDDLAENVFMNLMRGKDLLDLFVMVPILIHDSVTIMRPMLNHPKSDIYEMAHKNNIMYFKDTTSDSCFRGTIRRQIFPAIEKFDKHMLDSLLFAGKRSSEWNCVVEKIAIKPILQKTYLGKTGFKITFDAGFEGLPYVFWSKILINLFHANGIKMTKNKNLIIFTQWTNKKNILSVIHKFTNGMFAINDKNTIYFFNSKFFLKESPLWKTSISPTTEYLKFPMSLDNLLDGEFLYTVQNGNFSLIYNNNRRIPYAKLFTKLHGFGKCIPKITSDCSGDSYSLVTISLK